jgi:ubiquinone/menaquinone biosynthesis C-methylase UbiE
MDISMERTPETTETDATVASEDNQPQHAQFVGSIPQIYDEHLGPLLFEFAAADIAQRVDERLPANAKVLEVACGTGISTDHLWRRLSPEAEIVATDLNEAMLGYAQHKRSALTNVSFRQADAQALPFVDGTFDAVVCQFGLMFFPDKAQAMAEFARVLRPGGFLALNVWDSLANNRVADIAQATIAGFFETDPPDFLKVPFGYHNIETICDLIGDAGLTLSTVDKVSATIERPDALSVARGFVEGNPGILQIQERATADAQDIVRAVANEIGKIYGPGPLRFPLTEIVFLAERL